MSQTETKIMSPVTGSDRTRILEYFSVADIVEIYEQQENIDVRRNFGSIKTIELVECLDTNYRFFHPHSIAGDEQFYEEFQKIINEGGLSYDRDGADDHLYALSQIKSGAKLLEIGCNTGKFLELAKENCESVRGLEFSERAFEKARAKGLDVLNESIADHVKQNAGSYDVVCAFQVLEHVTDVGDFVRAVAGCVKPGGAVIFSVPNNEPYFQRFSKFEVLNLPPHHVGLWNLESLRKLGKHFGLRVARHNYSQTAGLLVDAYVRSRFWTGIKTPPAKHGLKEKLAIWALAPLAGIAAVGDVVRGSGNHAHITVVFEKPSGQNQ